MAKLSFQIQHCYLQCEGPPMEAHCNMTRVIPRAAFCKQSPKSQQEQVELEPHSSTVNLRQFLQPLPPHPEIHFSGLQV